MTVEKVTIDKVVFVNNTVSFVIVVSNTGDCDLHDITVTEDFNTNELRYEDIVDSTGKWSKVGDYVFTYDGTLSVNDSANFTVIFTALTNGNLVNTVNATSNETENKTTNNTTEAKPICDLVITKEVNASSIFVNDCVEWTISVVNNGPSTAKDVVVKDTLPEGVEIIGDLPNNGQNSGRNVVWKLGDLKANEKVTLTFVTKITIEGNNTNMVVVNTTTPESNESNNEANNTTVANPICDVAIFKLVNASVVNVSDTIKWTIVVVNNGPSTAKDVVVKDTLPKDIEFTVPEGCELEGNCLIWSVGDLNVGQSASLELIAKVLVEGNVTNIVVVNSSTPDSNESNNHANNTTVVKPLCDLEIIKLVSSKKAYVGEELTWTIRVTNHGPSDAVDVKVLEDIPDSLQLIRTIASKGTFDKNTNIWTIGKLANGASETLQVVTKVLSVGNITNPVEVSTSTPDTNKTNDKANNTTTAYALADLELTKSSDKKVYYVGDEVHWLITVVNHGPSAACDVVVKDALPSETKFISYTADKGSFDSATGTWTIGDMENGERVTLDILCKALKAGEFTNNANVTSSTNDSDESNNHDNATITVIEKVTPTPEPTPDVPQPTPEQPVNVNVGLKNTGNPIVYLIIAIFVILGSIRIKNKKD